MKKHRSFNELNRLLDASRIVDAIQIIEKYSAVSVSAGNKQWVIDQIAKTLLGPGYNIWAEEYGDWDTGSDPRLEKIRNSSIKNA